MQNYDNKLKHFVAGQVPDFVSENHPMFVAFMEAYFEWLYLQEDRRRLSPLTLLDQRDIDKTLSSFVEVFREEYLKNFPKELAFNTTTGTLLDERLLMKHIRSFYKAKGTEKSYKFLFMVLYHTYAELYYPKTDILRVSDGKWNTQFKIKTTSANGQRIFDYEGGTVSQRDGNGILKAYANIKGIIQYSQGGYEVTEYIITQPFGVFEPNKPIQISSTTQEPIFEKLYMVLTGFEICSSGEGQDEIGEVWRLYKIGDRVTLSPRNAYGYPQGIGGFGQVSDIDIFRSPFFVKTGETDARGPVKQFKVVDGGVNYNSADWKAEIQSIDGRGTAIVPKFGAVIADLGFYSNDDGHVSSKKKLQDNFYYQEFSYVIKTDETYSRWIEVLKKLIHPAGMAVFAQQYLYRISGYRVDDQNYVTTFEDPVIGHYTPYRFKTYENLRHNSAGVDLYPTGYNPERGTVLENGTTSHDPGSAPLTEGIVPGVNNIWCPTQDHSTQDYQTITANSITGGCRTTEELQAKHEIWQNCTGTEGEGSGCCLSCPYWIIYTHPNSRGYSHIPPYTCETVNGEQISYLTRFSCIKLDDFFHMKDNTQYHEFVPQTNKFSVYAVDDFVSPEARYSDIPDPEIPPLLPPPNQQGEAANAILLPNPKRSVSDIGITRDAFPSPE
jgi:hypothetical protein